MSGFNVLIPKNGGCSYGGSRVMKNKLKEKKMSQNDKIDSIGKQLNKALIEIFGKDLPENTNIYTKDK